MDPRPVTYRVLVIEDDPITLEMLRQTFQHHRWECFTATNGAQGWALAKQEIPDVILSDLLLPMKHGFQILRQAKSDAQLRSTKVVIMTASGNEQTRAEARQLGAEAYFDKPFDLEELVKTLTQLLAPATGQRSAPKPTPAAPGDRFILP